MIFQWGLSFFGLNAENLFGIDHRYMVEVSHKETFLLVGHGFDAAYLRKIPIALKRYYFHLLIEKNQAERGETPQFKNRNPQKFDPVQKGK